VLDPSWLTGLAIGDPIAANPLDGGYASKTFRVRTTLGRTVVVKTQDPLPPDLYYLEADGLNALRSAGGFAVPEVLRMTPSFIVLSDLGTAAPSPTYWEDAGRALAAQHAQTAPEFGYHQDNYLGLLPQRNPWTADGHAFYAEHRLLRFLEVPTCHDALSAEDRRALERVAERLPELIPAQPAALLHGDFWHGNLLTTTDGGPAVVDPAVHYGWPEADISMLYSYGNVPDAFYSAYEHVHPLAAGWRERAPVLQLREHLSVLAHGPSVEALESIRSVLKPFTG
jgi:fructosamine-3-kinase